MSTTSFAVAVRHDLYKELSEAASLCGASMGELIGGAISVCRAKSYQRALKQFALGYRGLKQKSLAVRPHVQVDREFKPHYGELYNALSEQVDGLKHAELGHALARIVLTDPKVARLALAANAARQAERLEEKYFSVSI